MLVMAVGGCASMGKPSPLALGMAKVMNDRQDMVASTAALADIRIDGLERLEAPFPATFTATLRHTAPDLFSADAFGPMGLLLFHYTATEHSWLLETPGQPPAGGPLAANGRAPATLLLDTLAHLLDGVRGVPLGNAPPRAIKGGWRTGKEAGAVRFHMDRGNLSRVTFKRRGIGPVEITYADYRPLSTPDAPFAIEAPHAIELSLPRHRVTMHVRVSEWAVETRAKGGGIP